MKILHFSDTHLGYKAFTKTSPVTHRNQRTTDFEDAVTMVVDDAIELGVDGVIHSGDVFHHIRPTFASIEHFINQVRRLDHAGIPTLVIAGNHDTPRARIGGSVYNVIRAAVEATIIAGYDDVVDVNTFAELELAVHAVPWGALTNTEHVQPIVLPGLTNFMISHGTVPGVIPHGEGHSEQPLDIHLLDTEFDYVALGHIHQAQQCTYNTWYAGSTERCGWSDIKADPGYLIWEDGHITHHHIKAREMRDLGGLDVTDLSDQEAFDHLMARIPSNREAIVRFTLITNRFRGVHALKSMLAGNSEVWHTDIKVTKIEQDGETPVQPDEDLSILALFEMYVEQKKAEWPEGFAEEFAARGKDVLTSAAIESPDLTD